MKSGFTLVEVLITVGIIGVVAALTIPTIIQNSNNRKFASQFKKTMSTLSQAAIMSQAQYDTDYASLNTASSPDDCAEESLAKSNLTMCGLFNSTLSGHTFLGVYGVAKGANASSVYQVSTKALPALDENIMIFALADGSMIGFNKNATRCGVTPGTPMSAEVLSGALANCVGFIDVNGPNSPNKEVTCKNADDTALNPSATCAANNAIGDVFPVVFHDGIVEPASNAARAVLSAGKGTPATGDETGETASSSGGSEPEPTAAPEPQYTENGHKIGKRDDPSTWEAFTITTGLTQSECEALPASYGITNCPILKNARGALDTDKWAAAVAECGGVQNMLTDGDLSALAQKLFSHCGNVYNYEPQCDGPLNTSEIPENLSGLGSEYTGLWSASEISADKAASRGFGSSGSRRNYSTRNSGHRVVCVEPATE